MNEIRNGILYIDGIDSRELVREYGSPVMVMSKDTIIEKCNELKSAFTEKYENTRIAYAGKAFLCGAMIRLLNEEGLCLDVVSDGELYTAVKAGFPPERIEFNGNNKSMDEIRMAVEYGVSRIIVDGRDEISLIEEECKRQGKTVNVMIRFSPGVDSHTHQYITTGNIDSKFGVPLSDGIIDGVIKAAMDSEYINLLGFHFHVGSQLHDNQSHVMATGILLEMVEKFRQSLGFVPKELNLGGGFGIHYTDEDQVKPFDYFLDPVMEKINEYFAEKALERPAVVIEPGRSVVGEAGTTLYTVGTIKDIPGVREYVSVNGGMTDNIRPAMYGSEYECHLNVQDGENRPQQVVTICGKCCESGDILIRDVKIPAPERGDILGVFSTGAYCYAMSSNYNMIRRMPVVMTSQGHSQLIIKGQSYEDLIANFL